MKTILAKLSPEEIKALSKELNKQQKKLFGNPLSLRKQEQMMADIFGVKDWSTLLGTAQSYDPKSEYQKTIVQVEVLSNGAFEYSDLDDLVYSITHGDCVGSHKIVSRISLSEKEAAQELIAAGSEPGFLLDDRSKHLYSKDEIFVFEELCNILKEKKPKIWNEATSDIVAQNLLQIFTQERDRAISQHNRAVSHEDLDAMSSFYLILANDDISFTENDLIIMLRD